MDTEYASTMSRKSVLQYRHDENIAAIAMEFGCSAARPFVDFYTQDQGMNRLFEYIIDAANVFSYTSQLFGEPSEDYDWVLALQDYTRSLIADWEHAETTEGLIVLAKRALFTHRFLTETNPNLSPEENNGIFRLV